MARYCTDLDIGSNNAPWNILKNIQPNTRVLEVGGAGGRLTKYLKETLNCNITIVEIDEESGKIAAKWADQSFIGKDANIEKNFFINYLSFGPKFDYIIYCDVLEHLYNPYEVLSQSKQLLVPNGSIWISIPNISHNSVIIDLLNGKFNYRELGLLDKTHIRFFTQSSLFEMVDKAGFNVCNVENTILEVHKTEFHHSYDNAPQSIVDYLKSREYGEIYQFVWELKAKV